MFGNPTILSLVRLVACLRHPAAGKEDEILRISETGPSLVLEAIICDGVFFHLGSFLWLTGYLQ